LPEEAKNEEIEQKLNFKEEVVHHSPQKMNYSGHFVSASALEKEYPAGSTFKRTFVMKNDGEISWPGNVHLI